MQTSNNSSIRVREVESSSSSVTTLLVKHLPEGIPQNTLCLLFSHYNASFIRPTSAGRNSVTWNATITGGKLDSARSVFDEMLCKNVASWTGMIESGFRMFEEIFKEKKNLITWTSIITGFAIHGMAKEALGQFEEMEKDGLRPNRVTFLSVINACSHGGLINEGLTFYSKMVDAYRILPDIKNYGCIVDMLGRAGMLEYAERLAMGYEEYIGDGREAMVETMCFCLISSVGIKGLGMLRGDAHLANSLIDLQQASEGMVKEVGAMRLAWSLWTSMRMLSALLMAIKVVLLKGMLRNCAFVDFKDEASASHAQSQLNRLRFLGKVLSVERANKPISKSKNEQIEAQGQKDSNSTAVSGAKDVYLIGSLTKDVHNPSQVPIGEPIASRIGVDYPFPPHLEYAYPPPDGNILTNIVNALIAVPRFYTQVLHLMNKMNIPAPFRLALPTPPLPTSVSVAPPHPPAVAAKPHSADLSSDESELDSSEEGEDDGKSYSVGFPRTRKRTRREFIVGPAVDKDVAHEAVGLKPATLVPKEIPMIKKNPTLQIKFATRVIQDEPKDDDESMKDSVDSTKEGLELRPFATLEEIESGKLPPEEILSLPMFKNYSAGNPTTVLYVKNLAKDVVADDFYFIFGSFFETVEATKLSLNVKLMQEGRMRGQAFVTFPSVDLAHRALKIPNPVTWTDVKVYSRSVKNNTRGTLLPGEVRRSTRVKSNLPDPVSIQSRVDKDYKLQLGTLAHANASPEITQEYMEDGIDEQAGTFAHPFSGNVQILNHQSPITPNNANGFYRRWRRLVFLKDCHCNLSCQDVRSTTAGNKSVEDIMGTPRDFNADPSEVELGKRLNLDPSTNEKSNTHNHVDQAKDQAEHLGCCNEFDQQGSTSKTSWAALLGALFKHKGNIVPEYTPPELINRKATTIFNSADYEDGFNESADMFYSDEDRTMALKACPKALLVECSFSESGDHLLTTSHLPHIVPFLVDSSISIDIVVEYNWVPSKCLECCTFGHSKYSCPKEYTENVTKGTNAKKTNAGVSNVVMENKWSTTEPTLGSIGASLPVIARVQGSTDNIVWTPDADGVFTVAAAYKKLMGGRETCALPRILGMCLSSKNKFNAPGLHLLKGYGCSRRCSHSENLVNGYAFKGKPMIIQFGRNPGARKTN
ncbi:hypothetical protein GIB67_006720 [Kingdonia uniflora]|uniref:RRM domain-containing protein n=1 Tax=Kingdonia uniflora TaxID=39325 RepID=A0A7J7LYS1_9MAGN|nr:hypothetical protein GIB67_006720 [Kingdonia uniflora]